MVPPSLIYQQRQTKGFLEGIIYFYFTVVNSSLNNSPPRLLPPLKGRTTTDENDDGEVTSWLFRIINTQLKNALIRLHSPHLFSSRRCSFTERETSSIGMK